MFLKKQPYNDLIFFIPSSNPLMIKNGLKKPFKGFLFQRVGQFGDVSPVDLTYYDIYFKLINQHDKTVVYGLFNKLSNIYGEIEYNWKDFETDIGGSYTVQIELVYNKPQVENINASGLITIDFLVSNKEYIYEEFNLSVKGEQLIDSPIIIEVNDTKEIIAKKISDAINLSDNNFTSNCINNIIFLIAPENSGSRYNNENIEINSDDKIVTSSTKMQNGQDFVPAQTHKVYLPTEKDYYRVVID